MVKLYPLFLNIEQKNCLVVGGGSVACRKVKNLLECGASVEVITMEAQEELIKLSQEPHSPVKMTLRPFQAGDEKGRFLVFAATGDSALNCEIAALCRRENTWLNAVDDPENCDFYVPALLRRGEVTAAVSTSGNSPILAAHLRDQIARILPEEVGTLAQILGEVREKVAASALTYAQKKEFYRSLLAQDFIQCLEEGKEEEVRERVNQCISSWLD